MCWGAGTYELKDANVDKDKAFNDTCTLSKVLVADSKISLELYEAKFSVG